MIEHQTHDEYHQALKLRREPEPVTLDLPVQTALPCEVHRGHTPRTHVNERHHVWPLGHGGPNRIANIVVVCATGHNNIHSFLSLLLDFDGKVEWNTARQFTSGERDVAMLGYKRIKRGAM